MKKHYSKTKMKYDGAQLRPLFAHEHFKISGNSIVSWVGPCHVDLKNMIDLEDKLTSSLIAGDEMIHFIVEVFDQSLLAGVALQRLFASIIFEYLSDLLKNKFNLKREGDDIYWLQSSKVKKKLSISIASKSAVSLQIHFAVNVTNSGTPVPTCSLSDFKIKPDYFSKAISEKFAAEFESIVEATQKVYPL